MPLREIAILLPCHSLEDFPTHLDGDEAGNLLTHWTSMWHPALISAAGRMPTWHRVDDPPESCDELVLFLPACCRDGLPTGFQSRAQEECQALVTSGESRDALLPGLLEKLEMDPSAGDSSLMEDFLALGYCYLQIELLTRQMRYSSNLDEVHFGNQVVAAANAWREGNQDESRSLLQSCFDLLSEERDHYYSVDTFFVDITLLVESLVGQPIRDQLSDQVPTNLLLDGELLQGIAGQDETQRAISEAVEQGRCSVVGGDDQPYWWPLMSCESLLRGLRAGLREAEIVRGIQVYGRRLFGLTTVMPQILSRLGFRGAVHATYEDGRVPGSHQSKVRWEGRDGTSVDALCRVAVDASSAQPFLGLAGRLGDAMDTDHVATLVFAHWAGQQSPWYRDLRRIAQYGQPLGKFITLGEYFEEGDYTGYLESLRSTKYQSPYLKQSIIRQLESPIGRWMRYWQRRCGWESTRALQALSATLSLQVDPPSEGDGPVDSNASAIGLDEAIDQATLEPSKYESLDQDLETAHERAVQLAATHIPNAEDGADGYLIINPQSHVRRVPLLLDLERPPSIAAPVYAAQQVGQQSEVVVDVPGMGYVWVSAGDGSGNGYKAKDPLLAEETTLRNEYFEAVYDRTTGAMLSFREYNARGNRLSQQLALRTPNAARRGYEDPTEGGDYSVMAADSVRITTASHVSAELVCEGKLLSQEGEPLAEYRQTSRVWRGCRTLLVDVDLTPLTAPRADPWNAYFCSRFAWADQSWRIIRCENNVRQPIDAKRIQSPLYLELEGAEQTTTLFTAGLPFHRRIGFNFLDSILSVRGETTQRFRFGIGMDVAQPYAEARALMQEAVVVPRKGAPPAGYESGWFFHIDARNTTVTDWEPLVSEGHVNGLRIRILETSGRKSSPRLRCFREIQSAQQTDFLGESQLECPVEDGGVKLEIAANEWLQVDLFF